MPQLSAPDSITPWDSERLNTKIDAILIRVRDRLMREYGEACRAE